MSRRPAPRSTATSIAPAATGSTSDRMDPSTTPRRTASERKRRKPSSRCTNSGETTGSAAIASIQSWRNARVGGVCLATVCT
jgi:hypothetical protein